MPDMVHAGNPMIDYPFDRFNPQPAIIQPVSSSRGSRSCPGEQQYPLYVLAVYLGLRRGELLGLRCRKTRPGDRET